MVAPALGDPRQWRLLPAALALVRTGGSSAGSWANSVATNQFEVFGVDVRDYGQLWMAAWRDALFGDDSPIRKLLDSEVTLRHSDGESTTYQAGRESTGGTAEHEAAIPEHLVLSRSRHYRRSQKPILRLRCG